MEIIVRKTTHDDVLAAEAVLDDGRLALAQMDIPQWQGEYPNRIDVDLAGEVFGSAATFGAVKKASAPGQISVNDLRTVLTILHQA